MIDDPLDGQQAANAAPPSPPAPRVPRRPGGAAPTPPPKARPAADPPPLARPRRRWLLVTALIVVVGVLLGVLAYLYIPVFIERVAVTVADNSAALSQLEDDSATLTDRLERLSVDQGAALSEVEASAGERLTSAEERLDEAETRLAAAEAALDGQGRRLATLEAIASDVGAQLATVDEQLDQLEAELPGRAEFNEYNRQLLLIRGWQDVLKVRLRLLENNVGLAHSELEAALETLDRALALSSGEQQVALEPVIERLTGALNDLEDSPFVASNDLEIGWYELGELISPVALSEEPKGTPAPGEEAGDTTPTPTPTPFDPTPSPTVTP